MDKELKEFLEKIEVSQKSEALGRIEANQKTMMSEIKNQGSTLISHEKTLVRNTTTVEEHRQMSINLKKQMEMQEAEINTKIGALQSEITPIKAHVDQVKGAGEALKMIAKWTSIALAAVGTISGIVFGILRYLSKTGG